jgi:hypothetical protein
MKLEKFKKDYEGLTPDERLMFHEEYGLTFKTLLDRVRDGFERLSDEDRIEFTAWEDDNYHAPCGQRLPEDEDDHECPVDDEEDEDGEDEDEEEDDDLDDEDDDDLDDEDDENDDAPDSEGSGPKVTPGTKVPPGSKDTPGSQDDKDCDDEDSDDEDFGEGFDEST